MRKHYNRRYIIEMSISIVIEIIAVLMYGNKPAQAVLLVLGIGIMALGLLDESRRDKIKDGKKL